MRKKSKFDYSRKGYRTTYVNRYKGLDTFSSTKVRRSPSGAWKLRDGQKSAWQGGE